MATSLVACGKIVRDRDREREEEERDIERERRREIERERERQNRGGTYNSREIRSKGLDRESRRRRDG